MKDKRTVKFSVHDRLKSFRYAFNGLKILFREEHNARLHLLVSVVVIAMGILFCISLTEWLVVLILIGLVFSVEIINSALENLCDHLSPDWHNQIKKIKDLGAAAVLISTIISVICGLIIFVPPLYNFIRDMLYH